MSRSTRTDAVNSLVRRAQFFVSALGEVVDAEVLEAIAGKDFSLYQLQILRLVDLRRNLSIGSLAAHLGVTSAATSKAVDRLVRRLLLHRVEREQDRRAVHLSLTAMGRRTLARFDEARAKRMEKVFGELPVEELRRAAETLQRLTVRIVESGAGDSEGRDNSTNAAEP